MLSGRFAAAQAEQVRTIDVTRVVKQVGALDSRSLNALDRARRIHLAL